MIYENKSTVSFVAVVVGFVALLSLLPLLFPRIYIKVILHENNMLHMNDGLQAHNYKGLK